MDRNSKNTMIRVDKITSLSARRAWIEISASDSLADTSESLSARRAWIEIQFPLHGLGWEVVALRKESVDRNQCWVSDRGIFADVALRKESVDRNMARGIFI